MLLLKLNDIIIKTVLYEELIYIHVHANGMIYMLIIAAIGTLTETALTACDIAVALR